MQIKHLIILSLLWFSTSYNPSILPFRRIRTQQEDELIRSFAGLKKFYDDRLASGRIGRIEERISTALAFISLVRRGKEEYLEDVLTYANEALQLIEENFPHEKPFNVMRLKVFALLCKGYYYEKLADKGPENLLDAVRQYLQIGKLIEKEEGLGEAFLEASELIGKSEKFPSENSEGVTKQIYDKAYKLLKRYIGYYNELAKNAESREEIIANATRLNLAIPLLAELEEKIPEAGKLSALLKFQIALYYKRAQALNKAGSLFQSVYEDTKESDPNLAFLSILNASLCYKADGQEMLSLETFAKLKPFLIPEPEVDLEKLRQCKDQIREMLRFASDYLPEMFSYNYTASKGLIKDLKLIIRKLRLLLSQSSGIR